MLPSTDGLRILLLGWLLPALAVIAHGPPAPEQTLIVLAGGPDGATLSELTRAVLVRAGLNVHVVRPPMECAQAGDGCVNATLRELVRGGVHVALVPQEARAPSPLLLRDAGLEHMGEAAPITRLSCYANAGPARSLLDLANEDVARLYSEVADFADLASDAPSSENRYAEEALCAPPAGPLALLRADEPGDAAYLAQLACRWQLRARVLLLATSHAPPTSPTSLALYCTRDSSLADGARLLGQPPCTGDYCAFEPRRLIKLVNARALGHSPIAHRILGRLALDANELRELRAHTRTTGTILAVRAFLAARPTWARPQVEARVAVLVPAGTRREVVLAAAVRAAAELAERDVRVEPDVRFKVELVDDACVSTRTFKYLTAALGSEYGTLSAIAGPACASAFKDIARQSHALALPVLAYTAQAPPVGEAERFTVLGAGDARRLTNAWAAVLARFGWRRLAVLSDAGARSALEVSRLHAEVVVHVELADDDEEVEARLIAQWAESAAGVGARVLLVGAEDARVVRAALCAGERAGLRVETGAVWLLQGTLSAGWAHGVNGGCNVEQLAKGYLTLLPQWAAEWELANWSRPWDARWAAACQAAGALGRPCARPPAAAALLYDLLCAWAATLRRLLRARPADVDDLHRPNITKRLVADVTSAPFAGLTGAMLWESNARVGPLALLQSTSGGSMHFVGRWDGGRLDLSEGAITWHTVDGHAPGDGGQRCALQPLADLLHADCRVTLAVTAALAIALLAIVLSATACYCRRRVKKRSRKRLAKLGLCNLSPKTPGLDRWELPRNRVVINRKLGAGAFGTVYGGHALLPGDRGWTAVAVKTLKAGATTEEKLDFLSEAEVMKCFDHENVVRLLGVITKTEPVCMVMEFVLFGDLKSFLLARRQLPSAGGEEVSAAQLTRLALGAARALSYLAQLHYVHRDVAARNCLVSAGRVLKLADFGMTRLVFENDYYRFRRKGLLPVRWMAPESLALGVFSAASDVWSLGVLMYEMVTFGALPHQGLSNAQVLAHVKAGRALDLPPGIRPQVESLIKSCWALEQRARPSAAEVAALLAESPRLLTPCPEIPPVALPADADPALAEARWGSWATPSSAAADTAYLSAETLRGTDAYLP